MVIIGGFIYFFRNKYPNIVKPANVTPFIPQYQTNRLLPQTFWILDQLNV
jgi:hypothetical protein